jgi:ACS family hexuronate transporter-like MFS transporter
LIWIVPWLLTYREPVNERPAPAAPAVLAAATLPATTPLAVDDNDGWRWWHAFLSRTVLLLLGIRFLTDPVWQFILFWFPKFLTDVHHLPLETVGRIAWVPFLAADIGGIAGGYASGILVKRGFRPPDARKWVMAACALMIPVGALLVTQIRASNAIVFLVAVVAFAEFTWMVTVTALAVDVLPEKQFGRMWGVVAAGSGMGGMIFSWAVGHLVTSFSYTPVFVLMGCLHPIALILTWLVARADRRAKAAIVAPAAAAAAAPQMT